MTALRVGLVGTGDWAVRVHGASAVAHPGAELTAVWGRDAARSGHAARELGCRALTDFAELVERCDVLTFAVPPDVQADLAVQAATAGRRLLLEKPLALDVPSGERVVRALGTTPSAVLLTRRWEPRTRAWLADLVATGGWGSGDARFLNALPDAFLDASPWRRAHGALWDVGPHALSVLEAVLGPVVDLSARADDDGTVRLQLRHEGGAASTADLSLTSRPEDAGTEVSFHGSVAPSGPMPKGGLDDARAAHAAALTSLVDGDRDHGLDADYGLHLTRLLARAQQHLEEAA